jgi:hypothetical protein
MINREIAMKKTFIVILSLLLLSITALSQTTGRLLGTVSGPDGAIPGANIVVKDNQTGREVTFQTSGDGSFAHSAARFRNLYRNHYRDGI